MVPLEANSISPCTCPGPELYYYEVVECGRRILLTGVLIFISPQSSAQAAMACIFAFASLLGFELLRPHLDPVDSCLYRLVRTRASSDRSVFLFSPSHLLSGHFEYTGDLADTGS